jgi:hypothetical protein
MDYMHNTIELPYQGQWPNYNFQDSSVLCCIGFRDGGTAGTGGRVPGTARAHPQILGGTAGWGRQ